MLAALIMAGGSGERFWPLSTPEKPKQLLNIFSDKTMIRETVDRIIPLILRENIFIATNAIQAEEIKKELFDIPEKNIIIEPLFKDTAAAIGYASLIIENKFKNLNEQIEIVVLASDHLIKNEELFREVILQGANEAEKNSTIVTLGIKPNKPETGYGYIEIEEQGQIELNKIYKVKRFREKPNKETAETYVNSGKYLWNSGMFIFTIETIFQNFNVLMPEHANIFSNIKNILNCNIKAEEKEKLIKNEFVKFEKISIDFGIMEYSKNIKVIPVDIGWNDIGSFIALDEVFELNEQGNNILKETKVISHDSTNNIIIGDDLLISLLGVKDLIVVKHEKNLLICHKDKAQDIKKIVAKYNSL